MEEFIYVLATNTGNGSNEPDYLAVIDTNPESDQYNSVIHKVEMHYVNDEIHRISPYYNMSSGVQKSDSLTNLLVTALASSRIYFLETKNDFSKPEIAAVIEPDKLIKETRYSVPVKALQVDEDTIIISMLGSENRDASGGFAVIDAKTLDVLGRWESDKPINSFNYDFSLNQGSTELITGDFCSPDLLNGPLRIQDLIDQKYGSKLHVWDFATRQFLETVDLGNDGFLPLNVKWLHNSENHALITSALSGNIWHLYNKNYQWQADKIAGQFDSLIPSEVTYSSLSMATSQVISSDDQFLYVAEWLKGRIRQYAISDIDNTQLIADLKITNPNPKSKKQGFLSGPSLIQLSNDGRRLYASSSFVNSWDKQFCANQGTWIARVNIESESELFEVDYSLNLDFSPARTRDIFIP